MKFNHLRKTARAPLRTFMLYEDDGYVFKARCINISEGGVLLENFPHIPSKSIVNIMLKVPMLKEFETLSDDQIFNLDDSAFRQHTFRAQIKTVRRYGETSDIDSIFVQIGCQFLEIDLADQDIIRDYVDLCKKNLRFLVTELTHYEDDIDVKRILKVAGFMGYGAIKDLHLLSRKVTADAAGLGVS